MLFSTCVAPLLTVNIARIGLGFLSVIAFTRWFSSVILDRGPGTFITTNCTGPHEENSWSGHFYYYWLPFLVQPIHCETAAYTSLVTLSQ